MRQPKPFYRRQTNSWYVELPGPNGKPKQYPLGVKGQDQEAQALIEFGRQQAAGVFDVVAPAAPQEGDGLLVVDLIDQFVASLQEGGTRDWYFERLAPTTNPKRAKKSLADWIHRRYNGRLTVGQITKKDVRDWIKDCWPSRKANTERGLITAAQRIFNWATEEDQELIKSNPIAGMKRPEFEPRETYLSESDWAKLVESKPAPELLDILTFLWITGARPFEARTADARHFNRDNRSLKFERINSKGKKRSRVIALEDGAFEIVARLAGDGAIFRNSKGRAWSAPGFQHAVAKLSDKVWPRDPSAKQKPKLSAYLLRHGFATRAQGDGLSDDDIGIVMGHAPGSKMVAVVYGHGRGQIEHQHEVMRRINKSA